MINSLQAGCTDYIIRYCASVGSKVPKGDRLDIVVTILPLVRAGLSRDSPSLTTYLDSIFSECYEDAREQAYLETGLPLQTFPIDCPYEIADVLDRQFWPE